MSPIRVPGGNLHSPKHIYLPLFRLLASAGKPLLQKKKRKNRGRVTDLLLYIRCLAFQYRSTKIFGLFCLPRPNEKQCKLTHTHKAWVDTKIYLLQSLFQYALEKVEVDMYCIPSFENHLILLFCLQSLVGSYRNDMWNIFSNNQHVYIFTEIEFFLIYTL